jgi:inner membrane protein
MMGVTHTAIATACGVAVARMIPDAGLAAVAAACAGGLLPDADRIGTRGFRVAVMAMPGGLIAVGVGGPAVALPGAVIAAAAFATVVAGAVWGHRTATHSLVAIGAVLAVGTWLGGPALGVALAAGWASHVAADAVTTEGVAIYWPWERRRVALRWFPTGSPLEVLVMAGAMGIGALALIAGG